MPTHVELDGSVLVDTGALAVPAGDSVTAYRSFAEAEAVWRDFECKAILTPYQRFDWLEAWYRHIGEAHGLQPLIVVARNDDGATALIWPLSIRTAGPLRLGEWMGCKLVNYRLGLYARETVGRIDRPYLASLLGYLRETEGLDALVLTNQPESWTGVRNPLLALPHQCSPSFAYSLALRPDFNALYAELRSGSSRKKLRRSERQIAERFGSFAVRRPGDREEVERVLAVFLAQKTERMREKSIRNVFARPEVMALLNELAERSIGADEALLDLFWLDAGGQIAATWAGTCDGSRMCGIINSFDAQGFSEHQPGEIILRHVVENCCERGLREFDLGVGEAQYKESWCPRSDRLFNSFLPLTAAGWAYTRVASLGSAAKRAVKQSNGLRNVAERLRRVPDET